MRKAAAAAKPLARSRAQARGACLCGRVEIEIDMPAFWAWHDHSRATQRAHGAACATYVGCWKSRVRVRKGAKSIARYEDPKSRAVRSFCAHCGTPLFYERARAMINIPRALFEGRTGREPLYHIAIEESPEWAFRNERLVPLKGYPGVMWTGGKRRKNVPAGRP